MQRLMQGLIQRLKKAVKVAAVVVDKRVKEAAKKCFGPT